MLDRILNLWVSEYAGLLMQALGDVMRGGCIGQVLHSKHPNFKAGDYVSGKDS